jgi:6-pyruvoyl-tetrahydropterin synthase
MARTEVYRRFVRPDLETSKTALDKLTKMFFEDKEVKRYMEEYQKTLDDFLNPKEKPKPAKALTEEEMKERIIKGIDKLKEFAFNQAEVIDTLEEPGEVIKLWKSLGLFGDEEEVMEAPRRYLPTMCSECRYKAFCEQECEDLCELCKYKKYAKENGVHYETKEQLINPNKD